MIYVISKSTFGSYNVRDIQCNANWCSCPYSDYALIPDSLVEGILATKGYCDITLNDDGTEVVSFTARTIPSVPEECCGSNTVLSVNGVKANTDGAVTLTPTDIGAAPMSNWRGNFTGNIDSTEMNGLYWLSSGYTGTVPDDMPQYAFIDTSARHQRLMYFGNSGITKIYERYYTNNKWYAWFRTDSIPNAMTFGTAYKTQEKWNGKDVFAKVINLGTMQASGLKNHAIGDVLVSDNAMPVELKAYVTDGTNTYDLTANTFTAGGAYLWNNGAQWYVNVTCSSDMSAFTGKAVVKWIYN